jgi:uncharacterized protein
MEDLAVAATEDEEVNDHRMYNAVTNGDVDQVRRLLKEKPDELTANAAVGSSWLHYAAQEGHIAVIEVFLAAGLDVNWGRRDSGDTPLVGALDCGQYETAKYLLTRGANPNLGRCLIAALNSETNSFELVKLLVENGVDVNQTWRFGDEERGPLFNALSWAIDGGRTEIASYLRAHGAVMPTGEPGEPSFTPTQQIVSYFEGQFGHADPQALREIVPTSENSLLIHRVGPTADRDSVILFTTGMSDRPLEVSAGEEAYKFAELMIELPSDWPLTDEALANVGYRWPIDWLRRIPAYVRDAAHNFD